MWNCPMGVDVLKSDTTAVVGIRRISATPKHLRTLHGNWYLLSNIYSTKRSDNLRSIL
jgi:hypothetical protein